MSSPACAEPEQPDAVVLQCGTDALYGDPCGVHNLSIAAYVRAVQAVRAWKLPTLVLGGGGYTPADHARTAAAVTAAVLGRWSDHPKDGCLTRQMEVPLHDLWPAYAQRPQLDVPAGESLSRACSRRLTTLRRIYKGRERRGLAVRGRGGLRPARREAARLSRPLGPRTRSQRIRNTIESPSPCRFTLRSSVV